MITDTASDAAYSRTPEANSRVTKKKAEPAYCVCGPKRCLRNS